MDSELSTLKKLDLAAFAESLGYRRNPRESSNASITLRHHDGDKIVVSQGKQHPVYFSVRDDRDHGSIIDFAQKRLGGSLGTVRKALREFAGQAPVPFPTAQEYPSRESNGPDRKKVQAVWNAATWIAEHPYLRSRGIPASILNDARFLDCWRQDKRGNALFLHFDQHGPCGYEVRNAEFKAFGKRTARGIWVSRNVKTASRIVITESPIDCLSYHALHGDDHADQEWPLGYVALGGSLGNRQRDLLGSLFTRYPRTCFIVATDNDLAGHRYFDQMQEFSPTRLERHTPVSKDWNDDLLYCTKNE